ncbi:UNVERIFIED_CONTAM: hypothetical protein GTU68_048779, partial [Idotea baltica]|nr:hypothetical protein [Idotea baltica]
MKIKIGNAPEEVNIKNEIVRDEDMMESDIHKQDQFKNITVKEEKTSAGFIWENVIDSSIQEENVTKEEMPFYSFEKEVSSQNYDESIQSEIQSCDLYETNRITHEGKDKMQFPSLESKTRKNGLQDLCKNRSCIKMNDDESNKMERMNCNAITKQFHCSECSLEFTRKGNLKRHMLTHRNVKLFKCSECNYACNQKSNLKLHSFKHNAIKSFKCSECSFECKQSTYLKKHLSKHSKVKQFICSECSYGCNQKATLIRHLIIHSEVKLFKCSQCNYECNKKSNLSSHMVTHSKVKPFKCSEC